MTDDISLKSFTALDRVGDVEAYVRALEAFDDIPQLQELKRIARDMIRPGSSLLDVGCGFGLETVRLARIVGQAGRVAGIDKSVDFILQAKQRAAAAGLAIDYRAGEAQALPYADASFEIVRAERLLIYLKDWQKAVAEMKRVARPGASLAFIEPEFGTTTINLPDRALVRRVMAHEADTAVVVSWLPGQLYYALSDLGLRDVAVSTRVVLFPQDLAAVYFADVGRNAKKDGAISEAELSAWLSAIGDLHKRGRLFGSVGYFLFTAQN
ncbi:MAG: methyltransferase domain-containing protein [Rhizobiales bacterium]|nr:methyltransferase domain-containing protein [Hyphomicrobiales bacterium]